jgi:2'-5' RNA ligase
MPLGFHNADINREDVSYYAVVIHMPEHLDRIIAPLRERYDPDYFFIQSHISLVYPFETTRPLPVVSEAIKQVLSDVKALTIDLHSIGDFYPEFPLVYWSLKMNPQLDELYKSLYAKLDLALPFKNFRPHVMVAREISSHRVVLVKEQIVPYLFEESFQAPAIDLVSPVATRNWVSVRTFPLHTTP